MNKFIGIIFLIFTSILASYAFEDYVITNDGKLTDISIENNKIIDVYPLTTIMNEKNTLFIHPLMLGKTRFCVLKNNKDKIMFYVDVKENETFVSKAEGFEIYALDEPPMFYDIDLDEPPVLRGGNM